jgi:NADH-quinone oxidoreductase subunit L
VTVVGAMTCLFAATVGTVQTDIKRVIAYSTCSQLGYMFFAAGVGAYGAAMFHLFTHAFFKALLFLGAGSVIHAMHHEQDMRYYGGLRKKIPITFWTMMAGTLAITGVGLPRCGLRPRGLCRLPFEGRDHRGGLCCGRVGRWRLSGSAWLVALLTSFYSGAGVPDLLRQAALGRFGAYPARADHGHHDDDARKKSRRMTPRARP